MKKSYLVIGLGRFGANVAKSLAQMNCDVLAVDTNEESVQQLSHEVPHCLIADATKMNVLHELGAGSVDYAIVAIGNNLQASILTVVNLKNLGVKNIIVRADVEGHKEVYKMLGATEVIIPEEASAKSLANQILSDSILDYYQVALNYAIVKIEIGEKFESKTLIELNIRNRFDVNIVGIIKDISSTEFYIPKGTDVLSPGNIVVVVGTDSKLKKFDQFLNS